MTTSNARLENMALVYQELLTVGERLRSNRQPVSDAVSFRGQIWEAVKAADRDARNKGYAAEDIELATFAVVAFLDESILNLRHPIFADWSRQPLQEQRYGHHIAGEIFFQNLQKLLLRTESNELADLLEIHYLCLLLGFAGRYSLGGRGELRAILQQTAEKLQRIRPSSAVLSPQAELTGGAAPRTMGDPWVKRLMFAAIASLILLAVLFIVFRISLGSGAENLRALAPAA